jgi:hypothetical protein
VRWVGECSRCKQRWLKASIRVTEGEWAEELTVAERAKHATVEVSLVGKLGGFCRLQAVVTF